MAFKSLKEFDKAMDELDTKKLLKEQARQVRWLYNNSNKCTIVYDEKFVRLLVHRLEEKIDQLKTEINGKH